MGEKALEAVRLFNSGYNCSQSVLCAFCEDLGMDFETAVRLSSSFGAGMGRLREVCGAVSGLFMAVGLKYGYTDPEDTAAKTEHYKLIQQFAERFKAENGSIICRELLTTNEAKDSPIPSERTEKYYATRPCEKLVVYAAQLFEELSVNEGVLPEIKIMP